MRYLIRQLRVPQLANEFYQNSVRFLLRSSIGEDLEQIQGALGWGYAVGRVMEQQINNREPLLALEIRKGLDYIYGRRDWMSIRLRNLEATEAGEARLIRIHTEVTPLVPPI